MFINENIIVGKFTGRRWTYNQKLLICSLLGLVALCSYLLWNRPPSLSIGKSILGLLIIWIGFVPSIQYLKDSVPPPFPFIPLIGLFYSITFGWSIFFENVKVWGYSAVSYEALILTIVGLAALISSHFFFKKIMEKKVTPLQLPCSFSLTALLTLMWCFLLARIGYILIPSISKIPSFITIINPGAMIAYGVFYVLWRRKDIGFFPGGVLALAFFLLDFAYGFVSGHVAYPIVLLTFLVFLFYRERKKLPLMLIGVIVSFYLLFQPIKSEYRGLTKYGGAKIDASMVEKIGLYMDITSRVYFENNEEREDNALSNAKIGRIANSILFTTIINMTPETIPYWGGETFKSLPTKFIPRILWPDKPIENYKYAFGRRYGLVSPFDLVTEVSIPWVIDLYVNFGKTGVVIGMALIGWLLTYLDLKLNRPEMTYLEFVVGLVILIKCLDQDSNFSLVMGNVGQTIIILYLIFHITLRLKPTR